MRHEAFHRTASLYSHVIRDLNVLIVEVEHGAWIQEGDPNFASFTQATRTIQSLLDSLMRRDLEDGRSAQLSLSENSSAWPDQLGRTTPWDFEIDFWAGLADQVNIT